jgi:lipase ATG15
MTTALVVATHALLSRKMPHSGAVQYLVMIVFLCLAGLLFLIGFYTFESSSSALNGNVTFPTHSDPYSYCEYRWENLTLVDYALLSKMSYSEGSDFTDDLNAWFPSGWEVKHSPDDDDTSDGESATFYDLYHAASELSVVAVRGTAGTRDIIQDIDIWLSVSLFQTASYVGPAFLQPATIDIIYWSNFMKRILKSPDSRFYFDDLEEYVEGIKSTRKSVVLTGHSLGGGLAKIVGAKESLLSVTFSSPGLMYTSKTVDIDYHNVHDYGITLKPDKDIIPKVDTQSGTVFPMDCDQGIATCHKIHVTICELLRSCGDPNGRGLKADTCPSSFDV